MKQRALNIYHVLNLLHIGFYGYIVARTTNIGDARSFIQGNSLLILILYGVVYLGLNYWARRLGEGLENPIRTVRLANILHIASIFTFVVAFLFYIRGSYEAFYLMLISFPLDFFAVVIAYRQSRIVEKSDDLLDDEMGE